MFMTATAHLPGTRSQRLAALGQTLMQRLREVTPEQVRSVAQRYFDDRQLTVGLLLPEVTR